MTDKEITAIVVLL